MYKYQYLSFSTHTKYSQVWQTVCPAMNSCSFALSIAAQIANAHKRAKHPTENTRAPTVHVLKREKKKEMTHPPDSRNKQSLSLTEHIKHISQKFGLSAQPRWLELGHLATGDYSSWLHALGTHRDTVCSLVAIPGHIGNQLANCLRALGPILHLGRISRNYSRTCGKSAQTKRFLRLKPNAQRK